MFPFWGYFSHGTHSHNLSLTTKANSFRKDKPKHALKISYIQPLRKTPKFSSHLFTSVVRIKSHREQVSLPKTNVRLVFELNHSAHSRPCMDISSTFLKLPDPRLRPLNSTANPQHIPIVLQMHQSAFNVLFGPGSLAAFWPKTLDIGGPNPPGV